MFFKYLDESLLLSSCSTVVEPLLVEESGIQGKQNAKNKENDGCLTWESDRVGTRDRGDNQNSPRRVRATNFLNVYEKGSLSKPKSVQILSHLRLF